MTITGCGIIPICMRNNKMYLLCGIEKNGKVSDLGGKINKNETTRECAVREFYEESVGLIMSYNELLNCKIYDKIRIRNYVSLIIKADYVDVEEKYRELVRYVNDNNCKDVKMDFRNYDISQLYERQIYPIGYFEFIELKWIEFNELKNGKYKLRKRFECILEKIN